MFGIGMYLHVFYCLFYVKDISMDILEEQVSEEIDQDLNEEEDIRMDDSRVDHWRDVSEEGDNKKNICALGWEVYIKEKWGLRNRQLLVSITHPKGGGHCLYLCEG